MQILKPAMAALIGVLAVSSLLQAGSAEARGHLRAGTWQNSYGGSGSWQRNTTRQPGSLNRETAWQNANGRSGSATLQRERDRAAGAWSSARSVTRGNGDTATWNKSGQKTETGAVVHGQGTNFRGQDVSMDRAITKNEGGSRSVQTTRVNETTGNSLATEKTVTKSEDGLSSSGSYTTGSGRSGTSSGSLARTEDGYTRSQSATNGDGQTASHTVDITHADGSATRTVTTTGFNGETHSHSTTVTPTPAP